jgi:hypothetical protein
METSARTRQALITIVHGMAGWALCGATMGIGMATTTLDNAVVIHAAAVPLIFAAVTLVYFRKSADQSPLRTAVSFLAIVIVMDAVVVALLIERSFEMFQSPLGTWLPFLLIFLSSWFTANRVRRSPLRPPPA